MVELEVFNSNFGDKVEPVVSVGEEKGEWKYTLNSAPLKEFLELLLGWHLIHLLVKCLKTHLSYI